MGLIIKEEQTNTKNMLRTCISKGKKQSMIAKKSLNFSKKVIFTYETKYNLLGTRGNYRKW